MTEYLQTWLNSAQEDLAVAHSLSGEISHYCSSITFHCQQSVEKHLKAFLIFKEIHFPRTHDLLFLQSKCAEVEESLNRFEFGYLNEYGVSERYPDDFIAPEENEVSAFLLLADQVSVLVRQLILKDI